MKITFGRLFDQSLVGQTKEGQAMLPFIEWVQSSIDNVARALTSSLTISDNMDAAFYTQRARSVTTAAVIEFRVSKAPKALLLAQQSPIAPVVTNFAWQMLANGNCQANLTFSSAPTAGVDVVFLAFHG